MSLTDILPGNAQHIGARGEQQDSFGFSGFSDGEFTEHAGVMAVVADGMGGLVLGREVSALAVEKMIESYSEKTTQESIIRAMERALRAANQAVLARADLAGVARGNAGTTIAAVTIHKGLLYWLSVGDSRVFLWRSGMLRQLSADHVYSVQLDKKVAAGLITREQADNDPERAALTSFLGQEQIAEVCVSGEPLPLKPGDKVLLCSDGLYNTLDDLTIARLLAGSPQEAAERLVQEAIDRHKDHQDNVTVAMMGYKVEAKTTARPIYAPAAKPRLQPFAVAAVILLLISVMGGIYLGRDKAYPHAPPQSLPEKGPVGQPAVNSAAEGNNPGTSKSSLPVLPSDKPQTGSGAEAGTNNSPLPGDETDKLQTEPGKEHGAAGLQAGDYNAAASGGEADKAKTDPAKDGNAGAAETGTGTGMSADGTADKPKTDSPHTAGGLQDTGSPSKISGN